jgi:RNA polymerase sigma-70 factor, ECF subfamily
LSKLESQVAAHVEPRTPLTSVPAAPPTFAEAFAAYGGYVLQLLRRLGVREADLEDVAQEVFVVVHAQLPAFEGRSTLKTWICGIALRKTSEYRRKAYQRRERLLPEALETHVPAEQEVGLERDQRAAQLEAALAELPEKQLQVFVLYEIEELSMLEVARAVGCPRFTAYTRLAAARRALRKYFDRASQQEQRR